MSPQDMHKFSQSCCRSLPAAGPPRGGSDRNASPGTPPPPEGAPRTPVMGVLARGWGGPLVDAPPAPQRLGRVDRVPGGAACPSPQQLRREGGHPNTASTWSRSPRDLTPSPPAPRSRHRQVPASRSWTTAPDSPQAATPAPPPAPARSTSLSPSGPPSAGPHAGPCCRCLASPARGLGRPPIPWYTKKDQKVHLPLASRDPTAATSCSAAVRTPGLGKEGHRCGNLLS